jgi:hypothetical protein
MEETSHSVDPPASTNLSMDVVEEQVEHPVKSDPPAGHEKGEGDDGADDAADDVEGPPSSIQPQALNQPAPKRAKHQEPGHRRVKKGEGDPSEESENEAGDEESNLIMGGKCEKKAFCLLDGIFEVRSVCFRIHAIVVSICLHFFLHL